MNRDTECEAANNEISICFVAHNAFGVLSSQDNGHIGGIERQQALMAQWLADQGHNVSMITWNEGQGDCTVRGVKVFSFCERNAGYPITRFLHPRWTGLNNAMCRANADIYYYNCGDLGLGQVTLWAKRHCKKTVYSVASEPDCHPKLPSLKSLRERILYRYGLRNVDSVIVQTKRQQNLLKDNFGLSSTIIAMPCSEFPNTSLTMLHSTPPRVLWIGRFSKEKRLEWLLDIAESLPEYIFDVVGESNIRSPFAESLRRRASMLPNVVLHGRLIHNKLGDIFQRATLLCCTSVYEGFPNTFLEAWSFGLPVVSTFDPDNIIANFKLGQAASTLQDLRNGVINITENKSLWLSTSNAAKNYFFRNHNVNSCMPIFLNFFLKMSSS